MARQAARLKQLTVFRENYGQTRSVIAKPHGDSICRYQARFAVKKSFQVVDPAPRFDQGLDQRAFFARRMIACFDSPAFLHVAHVQPICKAAGAIALLREHNPEQACDQYPRNERCHLATHVKFSFPATGAAQCLEEYNGHQWDIMNICFWPEAASAPPEPATEQYGRQHSDHLCSNKGRHARGCNTRERIRE